jgi:hypothetical protein
MQVLEARGGQVQQHGITPKEKEKGKEGKEGAEAEMELARVDRAKLRVWAERHGVAPKAPVDVEGFVEGLYEEEKEDDDDEEE